MRTRTGVSDLLRVKMNKKSTRHQRKGCPRERGRFQFPVTGRHTLYVAPRPPRSPVEAPLTHSANCPENPIQLLTSQLKRDVQKRTLSRLSSPASRKNIEKDKSEESNDGQGDFKASKYTGKQALVRFCSRSVYKLSSAKNKFCCCFQNVLFGSLRNKLLTNNLKTVFSSISDNDFGIHRS